MTLKNEKPELTKNEIEAMREFHISIDWKGLTKAWKKIFYTTPFNLYEKAALKVEAASRKLMIGKAALLMPVGIILRNTSRSMYKLAKGEDS